MPGYKIAYPMVSADARRAGFNGVSLGGRQVYGTVADAECVQGPRHRSPSSWCDCGFYCFHERDEARALACDPQYAHSVVLDVLCSGRYFRYERGLRYARQTVRGVRVGRCDCGRAGAAFAGAPTGVVGWRRLVPPPPVLQVHRLLPPGREHDVLRLVPQRYPPEEMLQRGIFECWTPGGHGVIELWVCGLRRVSG